MKILSISVRFSLAGFMVAKTMSEFDDDRFNPTERYHSYPSDPNWIGCDEWNAVKGMVKLGMDTMMVVNDGFLEVISIKPYSPELYEKMKKELKDVIKCGIKEHYGDDFGIERKDIPKILQRLDRLDWTKNT